MANSISSLFVDLNLNAASFESESKKQAANLKSFGAAAGDAGGKVDYSMMEARHGVMLLGEELGVRMPRAVSTLIASIGPVGEIMAAAFPILGAIAFIEIIAKVVDHFDKAEKAAAKFAAQEQEIQNKGALATQALELENMKLNDQLVKLTGGAASNKLAEQILEVNKQAGALAATLTKDNEKLGELLGETSFVEKAKEWGLVFSDLTGKFHDNYDKVDAALKKATDSMRVLAGAEAEMDVTPSIDNQKKYAQALLATAAELTRSIGTLRDYGNENGANAAKIDFMTKKVTELTNTYKDLDLIQKNASKQNQIGSAEGLNATAEAWKKMSAEAARLKKEEEGLALEQERFSAALVMSNIKDQAANYASLDAQIKEIGKDTTAYLNSFKALADAQQRLGTDQVLASLKEQEDAIKQQAASRVITQQQANTKLKEIYAQEEAAAIAADSQKLTVLKSNIETYERALASAQEEGNLAQINAVKTLLNQELALYADTEDKILRLKEQYGHKQSETDQKTASENEKIIKGMVDQIGQKFADVVTSGKSNFADLFTSLEADIEKTLVSTAVKNLLTTFTSKLFVGESGGGGGEGGGGGGIGGLFGKIFGSIFGGGRAEGGPTAPGMAYLVGEQGPEMFVPHTPGTVVPNSASIASSPLHANVNIHVHGAQDPDTFRKASPQIMADAYRHLMVAHAHAGR